MRQTNDMFKHERFVQLTFPVRFKLSSQSIVYRICAACVCVVHSRQSCTNDTTNIDMVYEQHS